jgi:phosphoribosylformylglycinamidine synthase I
LFYEEARQMKFGIVVFPGSNCDRDTYSAVERHCGKPVYLWHKDSDLQKADCIILPGGFAFGDYLRTGAIARFSPIMSSVVKFANNGGKVIGICNGFQVLLEAGLLPGAMLVNKSLKFLGQDVFIKVEQNNLPFTSHYKIGDILRVPIAHFEGNYYAPEDVLDELEGENRVVFRYCTKKGIVNDEGNPNGALRNIAGICNEKRNVLGMMPHPERASDEIINKTDGCRIWISLLASLEGAAR